MVKFVIDNTYSAWRIPMIREAIKDAIENNNARLPEELADTFTISPVFGNTEFPDGAWRIDWA